MTPELLSAIRSILIAVAGGAVTHGWVTEANLEVIVAGVIALGVAAWGVWSKRPASSEAKQVAAKVEEVRSNLPVTPGDVRG